MSWLAHSSTQIDRFVLAKRGKSRHEMRNVMPSACKYKRDRLKRPIYTNSTLRSFGMGNLCTISRSTFRLQCFRDAARPSPSKLHM